MEDPDVALFASALDDNGEFVGTTPEVTEDEIDVTPDADATDPEADDREVDAEGEGEGDSDGDESDESGDGADAPADEGEGDGADDELENKLFEVQIGDDTYEVNLEELRSGYLRNEEYVNLSNELENEHAAKVEQLEAERSQLLSELEQYTVLAISGANEYNQVNWAALKQNDPEKYQALRLEALEARERADALTQRRNAIKSYQTQQAEIKHQAYLQTQKRLAEKLIPEISTDPDFGVKLVKYGKEVGYTEDEIRSIADARELAVLNAARLWHESQSRRKSALEKKDTVEVKPVLKPGAATPKNADASKKVKASHQRLKNEQSLEAAAAFFLDSNMV